MYDSGSSKTEKLDVELAALIQKAQSGDRMAFDALVQKFHDRIFRMVFYRTQSRMDAEDISQDVFIKACQHLPRLKDINRFQGWLYRIAVNKVRDYYRKKRFRGLFKGEIKDEERHLPTIESGEKSQPGPHQHLLQKEFWEHVNKGLDKLGPMEREVFMLRFFDELGISEIAKTLKKSDSTIKTHLYRALKKYKDASDLRNFLKEGV